MDASSPPKAAVSPLAPYQVLLEVAEAIASHRDLGDLFHDLAGRLHRVVRFEYLNLILHDPGRNVMRLHILETSRPTQIQPGLEIPSNGQLSARSFETQQPMVVPDIDGRKNGSRKCARSAPGRHRLVLHVAAHHRPAPAGTSRRLAWAKDTRIAKRISISCSR